MLPIYAQYDAVLAENAALRRRVEELKGEVIKWQRIRTPTHGNCCTCQRCGLDHDSCRCDLDELCDENIQLKAKVEALEQERDSWRKSFYEESDKCKKHYASWDKSIAEIPQLKSLTTTLVEALKPFAGVWMARQTGMPFLDAVTLLYPVDFEQAYKAAQQAETQHENL